MFAFVHGTNPEGLLLIEATGNSLGSAGWEYALLRSADAELHIELDGREVWTCDRAVHTADDLRKPYCVILSALEPDTRPLPARGCRIIGEAPKRLEQNMESVFRMLTIGIAAISLSRCLANIESPMMAQENAASPVTADETKTPSDDEQNIDTEKKVIQAATEHIARLKMRLADASGDLVEPVDRPLLAYGEPARANSHGTLWAFGTRGRPVAFVELWQAAENEAVWFQSVVRTGDPPLRLDLPDGKRWRPPEGNIARTAMKNAPRPSATKPTRLRQLKSLARQFTAHEFWGSDNSRAELRLLVQPVHRYEDAAAGIQDGAAFIFAHGTNPEIILLIEALGPTAGESRWHYSVFPTSSAQAHVEIDGREVWTRSAAIGVVGLPTNDYWLFSLPAIELRSPADSAAPNEKE